MSLRNNAELKNKRRVLITANDQRMVRRTIVVLKKHKTRGLLTKRTDLNSHYLTPRSNGPFVLALIALPFIPSKVHVSTFSFSVHPLQWSASQPIVESSLPRTRTVELPIRPRWNSLRGRLRTTRRSTLEDPQEQIA